MASAWEVDTSNGPGAVGMGCSNGSAPPSTLTFGGSIPADSTIQQILHNVLTH